MGLYYLSKMNTKQVQVLQKDCDLAFVPIGPTEVHSYYLPTMTDVVLAEEVCKRAAERLEKRGIKTLIAPPIEYCVADGLNTFPGNTTLRMSTVSALIEDVCISLSKWGFKNVVIIVGHGEPRNTEAILEGLKSAMNKDNTLNARFSEWTSKGMKNAEYLFKSEHPELEIHAGEHEVGMMLLRHPELVDREALNATEPLWATPDFWEKVSSHDPVYTFPELGAPDGYLGNPRVGTAETADKVFDVVADYVCEEVLGFMTK